jgi:hypothetical protein
MKRRTLIIIAVAFIIVIAGWFIWRGARAKYVLECLKFDLALKEIPTGVEIVSFDEDNWTDLIQHFVLELDSEAITNLLSGRNYAKTTEEKVQSITCNSFNPGEEENKFDYVHRYTGEGSSLFGCWIYTDENETKAYVMYAAD